MDGIDIGGRYIFSAMLCGENPEHVLLANVVVREDAILRGRLFRDHVWVDRCAFAGMAAGDYVEFSARVIRYPTRTKGIYVSKTHGIRCRIVGKRHLQTGLAGVRDVRTLVAGAETFKSE